MKIIELGRPEGKTGKFTVLFEDGSKINVSTSQIADFGIYSGRELTQDEYEDLRETLALSSAKARALRILGTRSLSAREMEKRLTSKGESEQVAQETVRWLKEVGEVDDVEYAAAIARHYSARGYGAARIKDELFRRGIPRDLWDDALCGIDNEGEAAYDFLGKKLKGSRDKADLRRATDALCRRGFSYEEARAIVNRYLENVEEDEDFEP